MAIRNLLTVTLLIISFSGQTCAEVQPRAIQRCNTQAYLVDPDKGGTYVRVVPEKGSKVIKKIRSKYENSDGLSVHVVGFSSGWFQIDEALESGTENAEILFKGVGWVHSSLVGSDGSGDGTPIFSSRSTKSRVVGVVHIEDGVILKSCFNKWVEVKNEAKNLAGWAAPNSLCTNAVTNCN